MSWERVQVMIRQDLEATAPSDAAILARFRSLKATRVAPRAPAFALGGYALGAFAVCAAAGTLLWFSSQRSPFASEDIRVTREVWNEDPRPARVAEEKLSVVETPSRSDVAPAPAPALSERSKPVPPAPAPSTPPRARSLPLTNEKNRLHLAPPAMMEPRWEDVARAMKDGEEARAHELIVQLRGSADAETRDNARLADVQMSLELRDGLRTLPEDKLATLKDLRATGATSSIRASARRLLSQIESGSDAEGLSSPDRPTSTSP